MDKKVLLENLYKNCVMLMGDLLNNKEPEYSRIIFIGSHGTGKTTLANELSGILDAPVVESIAREVTKNRTFLENEGVIGNNIPETIRKNAYQKVLCSMSLWDFMRWIDINIPCIMTRCPLDTIAYAMADGDITDDTVDESLKALQNNDAFLAAIKSSLFIYIPIEFELEDDGVRPTDAGYQKQVDEAMRKLIYMFGITPRVVSGTVDERLKSILKILYDDDTVEIIMENYRKRQN